MEHEIRSVYYTCDNPQCMITSKYYLHDSIFGSLWELKRDGWIVTDKGKTYCTLGCRMLSDTEYLIHTMYDQGGVDINDI